MKMLKMIVALTSATMLFLSSCASNAHQQDGNHTMAPTHSGKGALTTVDTIQWFSDVSAWTPPSPWSTAPNSVEGVITEKTGLKFEFNIPIHDGATKLSLMLVSDESLPDVMSITNTVLAKKLIEADKVWSMREFLEKYDPDSHLLTDFPEDMKQVISERDGGWYSYPSHLSTEDARKQYPPSSEYYEDALKYRNNLGIMINEKIIDLLGIKLEELETEVGLKTAYQKIIDMKLKIEGKPVIPLLIDGKNYQNSTLVALQDMFGVMPVDRSGIYRDRLLAPETKYALYFLYEAEKSGYIDAGQLKMDGTAIITAIATGNVFSYIGNTANTGMSNMDYWNSPGALLSSHGTKPALGRSERPGSGWIQTYISKSTQYPEKIAKWLSYMSSHEGMLLHNFGFEGQHYTLNGQGLVVQTQEGIDAVSDYARTGIGAYWPFANISWHDSVRQAPTEKIGHNGLVAMRVQNAFGKSEHTVFYDTTPFELPVNFIAPSSILYEDLEQIKLFKFSQISKLVMAGDDEEFNRLYMELINKVKELGIEKIDHKINEQVQKQMKQADSYVKGINS